MKISKFFLIGAIFMTTSVSAQSNYEKDPESCTSIMVGKKATVDGSVLPVILVIVGIVLG